MARRKKEPAPAVETNTEAAEAIPEALPVEGEAANSTLPLESRTSESHVTDPSHGGGAGEPAAERQEAGASAPVVVSPAQEGDARIPESAPASPSEAVTPHEAGEAKKWASGPQAIITRALTNERHGPTASLGVDHKYKQMAIRFSAKPVPPEGDPAGEKKYTEMLHDAGWQWRGKEKVWTRQLDKEQRATSQQRAEEFFEQLVDTIRADHGHGAAHSVG